MKQQSIMLNANFQLIQSTFITDLLSNLKGLNSILMKMNSILCPQMCQNHKTFISFSLVHNFHMYNNNYIVKKFVRYEYKLLP